MNKIFDIFDEDATNTINLANLRKIAKELGETMTNEELGEMLERASFNGKEITRDDFFNIMTKKSFWTLYVLNLYYYVVQNQLSLINYGCFELASNLYHILSDGKITLGNYYKYNNSIINDLTNW